MEATFGINTEPYRDNRSFLKKAAHKTLGLLREFDYGYELLPTRIIDYFNPKYDFVDRTKPWKKTSLGLYVLVHGLNGHPACWDHHLKLIHEQPQIDTFVPYVPLRGNGPLEEFAQPICKIVEGYARQFPARPICLIGVSNGARVCTWIETQLRTSAPYTPVKVSTIAAVHFGSSRMNLIKSIYKMTGLRLGYHPQLMEDLCLTSNSTKQLMQRVTNPLPNGVIREFEFFGSLDDTSVPELFSSNPPLPHQARQHIVTGFEHNGIVKGVSAKQMELCKQWMNSFISIEDTPAVVAMGPSFQRGKGFWSTPADEISTDFFSILTPQKSQREDWYAVSRFIAEFWCMVSNAGFIAVGLHQRSPELLFAGIASILSHSIPKQWLLTVDKIGVLVVLTKLVRERQVFIDNPHLCLPLIALGGINLLLDVRIARSRAKTWPHVVWHLSAAAVANYILSYSKLSL